MAALSRSAHGSWRSECWQSYQSTFALSAALMLVGLLVGSALLLLVRRSAGALAEPLSAGMLILVGLCVATAVVGSRSLSRRVGLPDVRAFGVLMQWGPTVAIAMFAIALAIDGTSMPAMVVYLVLIVSAELFAERDTWILGLAQTSVGRAKLVRTPKVKRSFDQRPVRTASTESFVADEPVSTAKVEDSPELETVPLAGKFAPTDDLLEELPEATLDGAWQQVTRARTSEGELITGWVKTEFQPGERTAVLHVAFCPPLEKAPEIEIEQLSGPAARIKAAQVLPQGARFEIRLNAPTTELESLMLAFVAAGPLSDR